MIPAEAVEAAAKVLFQDPMSDHAGSNVPEIAAACESVMRKALEAAARFMLAEARVELVNLAKEFDGAEGGTLAYTTILDGRHVMRKNAHDQLMYILDSHLPDE